jgi:transcriptional regulator with XRE-family HTH domain
MARQPLHRTRLGSKFSEGARLLWQTMEARGWTQVELAAELEVDSGLVSRWLYGERVPGREMALRIEEKLGIDPKFWGQKPTIAFVPPAARVAA